MNKYVLFFLIWSTGSSTLAAARDQSLAGRAADYATLLKCAVPVICGCAAFFKKWWSGRTAEIAASQAARQAEESRQRAITDTTAQVQKLETANIQRNSVIEVFQGRLSSLKASLELRVECAQRQADQTGMLVEDRAAVNLTCQELQAQLEADNGASETALDDLLSELKRLREKSRHVELQAAANKAVLVVPSLVPILMSSKCGIVDFFCNSQFFLATSLDYARDERAKVSLQDSYGRALVLECNPGGSRRQSTRRQAVLVRQKYGFAMATNSLNQLWTVAADRR